MKFTYALSLAFLCGLLFSSQNLHAQTSPATTQEIGLRLSGLTDFDFIYKKEKSENRFIRYRAGFTGISFQSNQENKNFNFAGGLAIGWEKRKPIADRLSFIHGIEPALKFNIAYSTSNRDDNVSTGLAPSIGYILGFQYDISKNCYVNIEAIPSIRANFSFNNSSLGNPYGINAGFNSDAIALSLVYRFGNV